jgi:hypothetical protein
MDRRIAGRQGRRADRAEELTARIVVTMIMRAIQATARMRS